jgi:hypothetical protein
MTKYLFSILCFLQFSNGISGQILTKQSLETASNFVEQIKKAQHIDLFYKQKVVIFDIETVINGKNATATLTTMTNSGKMKLQYADGKTVVFDGKQVWLNSTDAAAYKQARFDIFMWQYFFMAPFKVDDAGTYWQLLTDKTLDDTDYARAKLTFKNGTGDTPNDWYVVHRNKATDFLSAMAYIVTFGNKAVTEAEKRPSGITYDDFIAVEGVQFATTWRFWKWSEGKGFYDAKGGAKIKNIRFSKPSAETFAPALGSKVVS